MKDDLHRTIPGILAARARQTPEDAAFMERDARGRWRSRSWKQVYNDACTLARTIVEAGVPPGSRAAILMPNSFAWELVQHGALMAGCEVSGLDPAESPLRTADLLTRIAPRVLAVSDPGILDKIPEKCLEGIRLILSAAPFLPPPSGGIRVRDIRTITAAEKGGPLPKIRPGDPALRIFTSGTTGRPKALTYTHEQVAFAASGICRTLGPFLPQRARSACWLPLSSPFQRMVNLCGLFLNLTTFMVSAPGDLPLLLREIRPHFLAGVPRFYEKVHHGIRQSLDSLPRPLAALAAGAEPSGDTAGRILNLPVTPLMLLADLLIFRKIRRTLGGSIRFLISGSAPLDPDIARQFSAWGMPLLEAYGMSENLLPIAMNRPDAHRPGSAGRPLPGNTVTIGPDGGIRVRGKAISANAVLDRDQVLDTGDTGHFDQEGFLYLTGRRSDQFKLSTGRKIAPLALETAIRRLDGIDHALICGAGKKYPAALVTLAPRVWEARVRAAGGPDPAGRALLKRIQETCRARQDIPPFAVPGRLLVILGLFSVDTGELTSGMKLKRQTVLDMFRTDIDTLYRNSNSVAIRRTIPS